MPRQPRLDHPGLLHHIMVRGIEHRRIFIDVNDYTDFLRRLEKVLKNYSSLCFAWALMPNHLHLLMRSGQEGIVPVMHRLLTGYALGFNVRHDRIGHLFQNRYKNIVCEEDPYFLELIRYIHLNPLRAHLVQTLEELADYPWTGHTVLMGRQNKPWQEVGEVLARFARNPGEALPHYEEFIADGLRTPEFKEFTGGGLLRSLGGREATLEVGLAGERQVYDERILGNGEFVGQVLKMAEEKEEEQSVWLRSGITIEDVLNAVSIKGGVDQEQLTTKGRTEKASAAKAMLIFVGIEYLGKRGAEMARLTKMSPAAASKAWRRGKVLAKSCDLLAEIKK